MTKHIILDTDIGGDPDDFFALLFALNSPEIEVDMLITSDDYKGYRRNFAKKILESIDVDIPIFKGNDLGNEKLCLVDSYVESYPREDSFEEGIEKTLENNEDTYYICIGPQSNLADFLDYSPELSSEMDVLIMGGMLNSGEDRRVEHNVKYDIESAREIFYSDLEKKYVLSNITTAPQIEIDEDHEIYEEIMKSNFPGKELLMNNIENFFDQLYPSTYMHDPLTLSYLVDNDIISYGQGDIEMDEEGRMEISSSGKYTTFSREADYGEFMKQFRERLPF